MKRAIKVVEKIQAALDREMGIVTRNAVTKTSQVAKLTRWLAEQGIVVESIDKASMRDLLARDDLTREVRRALEIRQEAAKSSTAKLKAFLACVCEDGRARGCIRYHGASTGRDTGELVQPQNFLRPKLDMGEIDGVIEALSAQDPAWLDIWAQPGNLKKPQSALDVIASCMRAMICAPAGAKIYAGDLSNIEGREAAWLADEQWKLEAFRAYDEGHGPDLYKVAAAAMLDRPIDDIDDEERQIGKVAELACIAEDELVLTDSGLVPIQDVTVDMRVWDGVAFVNHQGLVLRGIREVITYAGLRATPDHIVWTADGRSLPFGRCAREQIPLATTGAGRTPLWLGGGDLAGYRLAGREGQTRAPRALQACEGTLHRLRDREVRLSGEPSKRKDEGEPTLVIHDAALLASWVLEGGDHRHRASRGGGQAEKLARYPRATARARVYDLINAGPRRRFTVSGRLVHNCQFQGGHGAFLTMAANYSLTPAQMAPVVKRATSQDVWDAAAERYDPKNRYDLPHDDWVALRVTIDAWRARHPNIVEQWELCERAAFDAVRNPGRPFRVGKLSYACAGGILFCRLPNGRLLHFIDAKIREVETPWGKHRLSVTYMSLNSETKKYERTKGYGGLFFQNNVQAVARDVIMDAKLRFKARGWPTILKVHDELVTEITGDVALDEFVRELSIVPDWNHGCPIAAKAVAGRRYGK